MNQQRMQYIQIHSGSSLYSPIARPITGKPSRRPSGHAHAKIVDIMSEIPAALARTIEGLTDQKNSPCVRALKSVRKSDRETLR